jgi:hypothetical protein
MPILALAAIILTTQNPPIQTLSHCKEECETVR